MSKSDIPAGYELMSQPSEDTLTYEPMPEYEFNIPRAWEVVKAVNPGLSSISNAADSIGKIIDQADQHGMLPTLRDAGRGLTAGAYDAADVITSLGGIAKNPVSRKADEIADKIRADMEIPDSEVERVGELATEALSGGSVGGVIGKGLGAATGVMKKINTLKGAKYDRHIRKVAKNAGEIARDFKPRGKYPPRYNADMVEANAYNNLQKRDTPNLFSATPGYRDNSLLSKAIENMKYPFTGRGALERNNLGLESLFNQGHSLKDAQKILHSRFIQYPSQYGKQGQNIGAVTGMMMGTNGGSDNDIVNTPKQYRNRNDIQLEGGMPDHDSVMDMSDSEFNEYDRKYLGGAGLP